MGEASSANISIPALRDGIGTFRGKQRLWAHYKWELLPSHCELLAILSLSQSSVIRVSIITVFIILRSKETYHHTLNKSTDSFTISYYEAPRPPPHPPYHRLILPCPPRNYLLPPALPS